MHIYLVIAKKEFKDIMRSKVFLSILIIFLCLVAISVIVSSLVFHSQVAQFNQSFELLKSLGKTDNMIKPELYPLGLLRGTVDYIEIVWAILWIFLWYISAYREKMSKVFSIIFSRPVKKIDIIYWKLLWNFSFVLILMTFISVLMLVLLYAIAWANLQWIDFIKIILFIFSSSIYITIFFMISFFLCVSQKNIVNALILSFLIRLTFALIVPQIWDTMDTDNQVPGWFFKSMGLSRPDEFKVLDHFTTYENIRGWIEQLSITKHYERLEFALFGIKTDYNNKTLWFILHDKMVDIIVLFLMFGLLFYLNVLVLRKKLT